MLRLTLLDGRPLEIPRELARGVYAFENVLRNPNLKADGIYCLEGVPMPVKGPLPSATELAAMASGPVEKRPWLVLQEGFLQAVKGLPIFPDEMKISLSTEREKPAVVILARPTLVPAAPTAAAMDEAEEEERLMAELEGLLESA